MKSSAVEAFESGSGCRGRSVQCGVEGTGLLAQVLVAEYVDHLPLYRQESIFGRAGHAIARSTLAQ
jgi:transposase